LVRRVEDGRNTVGPHDDVAAGGDQNIIGVDRAALDDGLDDIGRTCLANANDIADVQGAQADIPG